MKHKNTTPVQFPSTFSRRGHWVWNLSSVKYEDQSVVVTSWRTGSSQRQHTYLHTEAEIKTEKCMNESAKKNTLYIKSVNKRGLKWWEIVKI